MLTDQSPNLVFGHKGSEKVEQVVVVYPDGAKQVINDPSTRITLSK